MPMRYKLLGRTGLRISELCLGTMTFGEDWGWGASEEESRRIFDAYMEAGGNFVDTANLYTNGSSERLLGDYLATNRDSVVLATKYNNAFPGRDPNAAGSHRKSMVRALEGSLRRLKTDYIDLYWLHIWDLLTPIEEVMRAMDDLVRAGKILYAGISDSPAWVVARGQTIAELRGWTHFAGVQAEYSVIERSIERELLPMARSLNLAVLAWAVLNGGVLSGKYATAMRAGEPRRFADNRVDNRKLRIVQAVQEVASQIGRTPSQVAINWVRQKERVLIPIIAARSLSQIRENLSAIDFALTTEQLMCLDEASRIDLGFPHDLHTREYGRAFIYGGAWELIDHHQG
jgi:aryl-alcohol dehydrogenase-like predicted oxidoreductase